MQLQFLKKIILGEANLVGKIVCSGTDVNCYPVGICEILE